MLKLLLDYQLFTAIHGFHEFGIDMAFAEVDGLGSLKNTLEAVVGISEVMVLIQD